MCVGDVCKPIHSSMFNWDTSHYEVNTYMPIYTVSTKWPSHNATHIDKLKLDARQLANAKG